MTDPNRHGEQAAELNDAALEALAQSYATPPPPELRARVLASVHELARERRTTRRLNHWRFLGIATSAAAATLAGFLVYQSLAESPGDAALEREQPGLLARLQQQESDLRLLEDALNVHTEVVRILTSPEFLSASLTSPEGGTGIVRVLLDPTSGAVAVLGKGLPPPQAGRVYELWAIRGDGTPEPAGTLAPAGERSFAVRLRQVPEPGAVTRFALSMEPAGGAARPTGPIVLAGVVQP